MSDWVLVLVGFSIITSIKEMKHSRLGNEEASVFYDLLSFALMLIAVLIVWNMQKP